MRFEPAELNQVDILACIIVQNEGSIIGKNVPRARPAKRRNGVGLVADDELYLKVDELSQQHFIEQGLPQFMYPKGSKMVGMSYYRAPEETLEDPAEMKEWAQRAHEAALRYRRKG